MKRKSKFKNWFRGSGTPKLFEATLGLALFGWAVFALIEASHFSGYHFLESDVHVDRSDPRFMETLAFLKEPKPQDNRPDELLENATESHLSLYQMIELADFLGESDSSTEITRRVALDSILDRGDEQDISFLFDFISSAKPEKISNDEWRAFVANIVEYLVHEWPEQQLAEEKLLALYQTKQISTSTQQAILKQLDSLYLRSSEPSRIETLLWNALDKSGTYATTALAALTRLTIITANVSQSKLHEKAISIVKDDLAAPATRVTAMQIGTWLNSPSLDATALAILKNNEQPTVVQLAAIATLLEYRGESELVKLKQQVNQGEFVIDVVAMNAIEMTLRKE